MDENFFISGTLEENLKWRCLDFDEQLAYQLAKKVGIGNDISTFHSVGLKATIQDQDEEISEGLSKKLAVVRIILHQPKIVIIMDTPAFVGNWSIV
jgi:ABC-type transport system involved in cytochrome bd biosynthesis fused ATPase/permease subunit